MEKELEAQLYFDIQKSVVDDENKSVDPGSQLVEGFIATSHEDDTQDIIDKSALQELVKTLKKRPVLLLNHDTDRPIGKMIEIELRDIKGVPAVWVQDMISKTEPVIWQKVDEGIISKYSIRARIKSFKMEKTPDERDVRHITSLVGLEHSLVSVPANYHTDTVSAFISKAFESAKKNSGKDPLESIIGNPESKGLLSKAISNLVKLFGVNSEVSNKNVDKVNSKSDNSDVDDNNTDSGELDMNKEEILADKDISEMVASTVKEIVSPLITEAVKTVTETLTEKGSETLTKSMKEVTQKFTDFTKAIDENKTASKEITEKLEKSEEARKALETEISQLKEASGTSNQNNDGDHKKDDDSEEMDLGTAFMTTGVGVRRR